MRSYFLKFIFSVYMRPYGYDRPDDGEYEVEGIWDSAVYARESEGYPLGLSITGSRGKTISRKKTSGSLHWPSNTSRNWLAPSKGEPDRPTVTSPPNDTAPPMAKPSIQPNKPETTKATKRKRDRPDDPVQLGASVALVLASATLVRGDPVPSLPRRGLDQSWQGGQDYQARYRGVRGSRLWMGRWEVETGAGRSLRGLGVGGVVDQTLRGRVWGPGPAGLWEISSGGGGGRWGKGVTEYVLRFASLMIPGHSFSIICLSTILVLSPLHFFFHPPAPGLCHMQTEGASGIEVLLAFRPPLGPSFAHRLGVASAAPGSPNS